MAAQNLAALKEGSSASTCRCDRFRFLDAPELGERCRQQAVGYAQARIGLQSATCGMRRFVVAAALKMPDGERMIGDIVQPVEWADPKRPLRPVDGALRFAGVG
jgi:hypothetical protein